MIETTCRPVICEDNYPAMQACAAVPSNPTFLVQKLDTTMDLAWPVVSQGVSLKFPTTRCNLQEHYHPVIRIPLSTPLLI